MSRPSPGSSSSGSPSAGVQTPSKTGAVPHAPTENAGCAASVCVPAVSSAVVAMRAAAIDAVARLESFFAGVIAVPPVCATV
jgi:hypothetical protein